MSSNLPEFEELVKLAKENPEQLEALRQAACDKLINDAPEKYQRKLRGLQFKIDMERRRARNPMAACIKISEMMHESFSKLRTALNEAQGLKTPNINNVMSDPMNPASTEAGASQDSSVIEFPVTT